MERVLWTDERLDDAFEVLRDDHRQCMEENRQMRRDWQEQLAADTERRTTERRERNKDRWAFIGSVIAAFGVLTPVIVIVLSNQP